MGKKWSLRAGAHVRKPGTRLQDGCFVWRGAHQRSRSAHWDRARPDDLGTTDDQATSGLGQHGLGSMAVNPAAPSPPQSLLNGGPGATQFGDPYWNLPSAAEVSSPSFNMPDFGDLGPIISEPADNS